MFPLNVIHVALAPLARLRDRIAGNLKVRVNEKKCRIAGQRTQPIVHLQDIWVENTTGQRTFIADYDVTLIEPVRLGTKETQWRKRDRAEVIDKGGNVEALGRTPAATVLAYLDGPLTESRGHFKAQVSAVGRKGFRQRPTVIEGEYEIADQ